LILSPLSLHTSSVLATIHRLASVAAYSRRGPPMPDFGRLRQDKIDIAKTGHS
jgi:hypothetical protein